MEKSNLIKNQIFPGSKHFFDNVFNDQRSREERLTVIYEGIINLFELTGNVFVGISITTFGDLFIGRLENDTEKGVHKIIKDKYFAPSIGTLTEIMNKCIHFKIRDESVLQKLSTVFGLKNQPKHWVELKDALNKPHTLGEIAILLEDLYFLYDSMELKKNVKTVKRAFNKTSKMTIFDLLHRLTEIRNKITHLKPLSTQLEKFGSEKNINEENWEKAFIQITEMLIPLLNQEYCHSSLTDLSSEDTLVKKDLTVVRLQKIYTQTGKTKVNKETILINEIDEKELNNRTSIIVRNENKEVYLDLYPFVNIKDDLIYYYKKSTSNGYQYFSIVNDSIFVDGNKTKFSQQLFNLQDTDSSISNQALFWLGVPPTKSDINKTVTANIPFQGHDKFIGRAKNLKEVKNNILDIVNRDGIIIGTGGIGKTALLIKLTQDLYNEPDPDKIVYKNIIWCSAKKEYFDPKVGEKVKDENIIETLESIFNVILRFFGISGVLEYTFTNKSDLVLDICNDKKILLILDNFESITPREQKKIIKFFDTDLKRNMSQFDGELKLIVTSRTQHSSSCYPYILKGLNKKDATDLIYSLAEKFKHTNAQLHDEQIETIRKSTQGIPLAIIHGMYLYLSENNPFDSVFQDYSNLSNNFVEFSFKEIIDQLGAHSLNMKILILMDILGYPVSANELSKIIQCDIAQLFKSIKELMDLQCIKSESFKGGEEYTINDEIELLVKSISFTNKDLVNELKDLARTNKSIKYKTSYSEAEAQIVDLFYRYCSQNDLLTAEKLLEDQIKKNVQSLALRFTYVEFLRDVDRYSDAIKECNKISPFIDNNSPAQLLRFNREFLLCYSQPSSPDYLKAEHYANEMGKIDHNFFDDDLRYEIASFKIGWSKYLKQHGGGLFDSISQAEYSEQYQKLASDGLKYLQDISPSNLNHKHFHLIALGHFNLYQNESAIKYINQAINVKDLNVNDKNRYKKLERKISYYREKPGKRSFTETPI